MRGKKERKRNESDKAREKRKKGMRGGDGRIKGKKMKKKCSYKEDVRNGNRKEEEKERKEKTRNKNKRKNER